MDLPLNIALFMGESKSLSDFFDFLTAILAVSQEIGVLQTILTL